MNVINDQKEKTQEQLLFERIKLGKLPIIEIAGHPFYVDVRMETLRPHDDFSTLGIPFSIFKEFEPISSSAIVSYNPSTHTLKEVDYYRLTEIPTDWIMIEIPNPIYLDPVGYARECNWDLTETLKVYPIQSDLKARILPWEETTIPDIIKVNTQRKEHIKARHRILKSEMRKRGPRK